MQIENLTLFHGLSEEETKRSMVCSSAKIETYEQDAYIFRQEDQPSRLYFILSGTVLLGQINERFLPEGRIKAAKGRDLER